VRTIHWELMGPALGQVIFNITIMTLVVTLFGTFVMKYFVRTVPLLSLAFIFFWAMFRVMLVVVVITFIGVIFDVPAGPLSGVFTFLGIGAVGTLITRHLGKHYGLPTKFPASGAKTIFVLFILMWVIVIAVYLLTVGFKMP
jgi:hypothetical protein